MFQSENVMLKLLEGLFFSLVTSSSFFKGPLQKKRKSTASLPHTMDIKDGHKKTTEMSKDYSCNMTAGLLLG